jgi:hypothetical protein
MQAGSDLSGGLGASGQELNPSLSNLFQFLVSRTSHFELYGNTTLNTWETIQVVEMTVPGDVVFRAFK